MHVSDEVSYELLQENEYRDISESEYSCDSEINVKILSCSEQSISSDEEENVSDNSNMQHGIWAELGAEQPHFPFTGKPGINVDLEDPSNPLVYFELCCTPEIAEVIAGETNQYANKFLENTPNLKLKSRAHHWKEMSRNEMKLLAFFLLQGLHQKLDKKSYFSQRKILEIPTFLDLFSGRRFHLVLKFLNFVDNDESQRHETRYNSKNCWVALCAALFPMLPYGDRFLEVWKGIEVQQVAKKCLTVRF
jgi:hypothetical protein